MITAVLTFVSTAVFSQDSTVVRYRYQHELGIDVANILTFLKRNADSYLLNYRWHYRPNRAVRAAFNMALSDKSSMGLYPEGRLGHQWGAAIDNWRLYGGGDLYAAFGHHNNLSGSYWKLGIGPVVGVQYFFNKHISLSTEVTLNAFYSLPDDPKSFDPDADKTFYEFRFGSVGMFHINYHFGKKKL
ncbi:hypothetical protein ECE50_020680 [Chitinophaga sp. Mgbs1]|uniref:Uncharacterized protein n=1 Tax=Chitinophaga solisilvae TaxID=1233460 RepID=A0A3S1CVA3_9BACT|nr:hypothetical protein [Chitinophaga solisilvae]